MLPICILAIRDDDDRAYMTRLFVKYQRLMYRTIYDILGDKWATEDVLQTTLLRLIDHLDTLRRLEPEGLAGYIAAACRHTAYNAVRDSVRMALTRARRKARRLMESQHNEQNV